MQNHSTARQRVLVVALLACLALLPSCRFLYPESDPQPLEKEGGPQFSAEDYALNAKEYFHGGLYGKARAQWTTQLELEPTNPWPKLGIAYCDYYLGREAAVRGDLTFGRTRLEGSEKSFRDLWNGELPAGTKDQDPTDGNSWRAALGLAMSLRGLGELHGREVKLQTQRLGALSNSEADGKTRAEVEKEIIKLRRFKSSNYEASISLFERLVAMEDASPEAIMHLADLYIVTNQDAKAEKQYARYLELAEQSWIAFTEKQETAPEEFRISQNLVDATRILDEKLTSNTRKRVEVLVNLATLAWGQKRYAAALDHLYQARDLTPDRLDLLIKIAQCEGEVGDYDSAIDNLDQFILKSSERNEDWSDNLGQAYRLRRELELKLKARAKR